MLGVFVMIVLTSVTQTHKHRRNNQIARKTVEACVWGQWGVKMSRRGLETKLRGKTLGFMLAFMLAFAGLCVMPLMAFGADDDEGEGEGDYIDDGSNADVPDEGEGEE